MYQDLHSHTYYSFCGSDKPEQVVEAAINGGIQLIGINDHNHGIGFGNSSLFRDYKNESELDYERALIRYFDHINLIKEKYRKQITVLCGIEVCTANGRKFLLPEKADISYFDYCLVENLDYPDSVLENDLFYFIKRVKCKVGIAHTDMFSYLKRIGKEPISYFKKMAESGAFWEMNVSYDSIHKYREHAYVKEFFSNEEQQEIIKKSGVEISIGFDGHRVNDYLPERVKEYCDKALKIGLPLAFQNDFSRVE